MLLIERAFMKKYPPAQTLFKTEKIKYSLTGSQKHDNTSAHRKQLGFLWLRIYKNQILFNSKNNSAYPSQWK